MKRGRPNRNRPSLLGSPLSAEKWRETVFLDLNDLDKREKCEITLIRKKTNFAIQKYYFYFFDTYNWFIIVVFVAYFQQQPFKRARFFGGSAAELLQLKHYFYHF